MTQPSPSAALARAEHQLAPRRAVFERLKLLFGNLASLYSDGNRLRIGPWDPRRALDMANAARDLARGSFEVYFDGLDAEDRHAHVQDARRALYSTCDELYRTGSLPAPILLVRSPFVPASPHLTSGSRPDSSPLLTQIDQLVTSLRPTSRRRSRSSSSMAGGGSATTSSREVRFSRPLSRFVRVLPLTRASCLAGSTSTTFLESSLRPLARARRGRAAGQLGADGEEAPRDDGARAGGCGAAQVGVTRWRRVSGSCSITLLRCA